MARDEQEARPQAAAAAGCGYWLRRGLETAPGQLVFAPGGPVLLLALLAAAGPYGVLLPRPCADWYLAQARLLARPVHPVPVPAECGGVPDPFALLEAVRRARAAGDDPRVLLLSVADDPTGTVVPPELLHAVCEVAADRGLLVVSDESWRDTLFAPRATVLVSPAEMFHARGVLPGEAEVVVLADLGAGLLPGGPPAALARFPTGGRGRRLRRRTASALAALGVALPAATSRTVADALAEPPGLRRELRLLSRHHARYAAALHRTLNEAGAQCRPPLAGRHLYADLEPLRPELAGRGVTDAAGLEALLVRAAGAWVRGGHHFGDHPGGLRVRLGTGMLAPPGAPAVPAPGGPESAEDGLPAEARGTLDRVAAALAGSRDGLGSGGGAHPALRRRGEG